MSCKDHEKCRVETHTIGNPTTGAGEEFEFNAPVKKVPLFEDVTSNHNKTLINIRVVGSDSCITIRTRNCREAIVIPLVAGQRRVIQVEDFKSLTFTSPVTLPVTVFLFVQKTFCICCEE